MMVLLFSLLLIAVLLTWWGRRLPAISFFLVSWVLGIIWFMHHATNHLNISL